MCSEFFGWQMGLCVGYLEAIVPKMVVEKPSNSSLALQSHLAVWVPFLPCRERGLKVWMLALDFIWWFQNNLIRLNPLTAWTACTLALRSCDGSGLMFTLPASLPLLNLCLCASIHDSSCGCAGLGRLAGLEQYGPVWSRMGKCRVCLKRHSPLTV